MDVLKIDRYNPDPETIQKAMHVLSAGGVVAHPTDTCYGLAADVRNAAAIEKVFAIKHITEHRSLSIIVSSLEQAETIGIFNDIARALAKKFLPGPLTLVVPLNTKNEKRKTSLPTTNSFIGIRIPDCAVSIELVKALGAPITTTSANITGQANPFSAEDVVRYFEGADMAPDLILDGGIISSTAASTVIKIDGSVSLLREGVIPFSRIERFL